MNANNENVAANSNNGNTLMIVVQSGRGNEHSLAAILNHLMPVSERNDSTADQCTQMTLICQWMNRLSNRFGLSRFFFYNCPQTSLCENF